MTIRLNIGCKQIYKPGYINIDSDNKAISDLVALPFNLAYKDNSVDLIESYNLLEQLTYEEVLITLEEWFRILKPGGTLIIESVNIDHILVGYAKLDDIFLKEGILKQLYQADLECVTRKSGHFYWKINPLLQEIGFDSLEESYPKQSLYKDCFRLSAKKSADNLKNMVIHRTKKNSIINLDHLSKKNIKLFWEFNNTIGDLFLKNVVQKISEEQLNNSEDFFTVVSYSPKAAQFLILECKKFGLISEEAFNYLFEILENLIKANFTHYSYLSYFNLEKEPLPAMDYYITIVQQNNIFFSTLFNSPVEQTQSLITEFYSHISNIQDLEGLELSCDIFSFENIRQIAEFLQLKAIKAFTKKDLQTAHKLFSMAIKLNPELHYSYANLGLIELILKNYTKALENFNISFEFVPNDKVMLMISISLFYLNNHESVVQIISNLNEDSYEKFITLGNSCYYLGMLEESFEAFSWALIIHKSVLSYINMAFILEKLDRLKEAQKHLKNARELNPNINLPKVPYAPIFKQLPFCIGELELL